jgi:hypothetical protein
VLLLILITPKTAAAQPLIEGFVESSEAVEGSTSRLHVTVTNRGGPPTAIELRLLPEALTVAGEAATRTVTLRKGESATLGFGFRLPRGSGETAVGVRVDWRSAESTGVRAISLGKVRVTKTLLSEITDIGWRTLAGAGLLAAVTLLGNWYLGWSKTRWDARQAERLRKDDVLRRAGEQVHELSQRHYARIVSWAASLDEEASPYTAPPPPGTPATPIPDERSEYLCYLLARYLKIEADMEDDSGGYFLRDLGAETVQTYLYSDAARLIAKPGYLDDEEYSHLVQQMGSRRTFVEFRRFVRSDDMAARVLERVQILLGDHPTLERMVHLVRLKWTLLELHINRIRADWYPGPIGTALDAGDLASLGGVLNRMVADGMFTRSEADEYLSSLRG